MYQFVVIEEVKTCTFYGFCEKKSTQQKTLFITNCSRSLKSVKQSCRSVALSLIIDTSYWQGWWAESFKGNIYTPSSMVLSVWSKGLKHKFIKRLANLKINTLYTHITFIHIVIVIYFVLTICTCPGRFLPTN